jgi:hypothetical protein
MGLLNEIIIQSDESEGYGIRPINRAKESQKNSSRLLRIKNRTVEKAGREQEIEEVVGIDNECQGKAGLTNRSIAKEDKGPGN